MLSLEILLWIYFCPTVVCLLQLPHFMKNQSSQSLNQAVIQIANEYFDPKCISILFNDPPPNIATSSLLINLMAHWATRLPQINVIVDDKSPFFNGTGIATYLHCSNIVLITSDNYTEECDNLTHSKWNHYYFEGEANTTKFLIIIENELDLKKADKVLKYMFDFGDIDVILIGMRNGFPTIYTYFPYGIDGNSCPENNTNLTLLNYWDNNDFILSNKLYPKKFNNKFFGCSFRVTTVEYPPWMIEIEPNKYDGFDYRILMDVSKHLNTTLAFRVHKGLQGWIQADKDGKPFGSLVEMYLGTYWVTASGLTNNPVFFRSLNIGNPFAYNILKWYFTNPLPVPTWKLIFFALSKILWIYVITFHILLPFIFFLITKSSTDKKIFKDVGSCVLALWSIALGNTMGLSPQTNILRFLFLTWLIYTMHINLAYTASLTGLITTGKTDPKITTIDEILETKLISAHHFYVSELLKFTIEDPKIRKANENAILIENNTQIFHWMINYRNICVVDNDVFTDYQIKKNKYQIYKVPINVMTLPTGLMMYRNHFMYDRINLLVERLITSGINLKYNKDLTHSSWNSPGSQIFRRKSLSIKGLTGPFYILALGILIAFIVFFIEMALGNLCK